MGCCCGRSLGREITHFKLKQEADGAAYKLVVQVGKFNLIGTQMTQTPSAPTTQAPMGAQEWAMLIALSVLWGGSFFFNGVAVRELPSLTIVLVRVGLAAVTLWAVLTLLNIRMPRMKGLWPAFFGMGLLNNAIPFTLFVWGQHHIASGLAAILNATTPLFTVLVAHFLTRDEKMSVGKMAGVALGILGVILMLGAELLSGLGTGLLAQLACLAAAISYAFCWCLWAPLQAHGCAALGDRNRPGHRFKLGDAAACAGGGSSLDLSATEQRYLGSIVRDWRGFHCARIYSLFPHPRGGGRYQSGAGDLSYSHQRHSVG
jgi:hypothetical protein